MLSSILYQNADKTLALLDIPRSIELAQASAEKPCLRRLISCKPLLKSFPSVEPKSAKAKAELGETSIKNLLLQGHIQFALEEVKKQHKGPWCLTRVTLHESERVDEERPTKKQKTRSPAPRVDKSSDGASPAFKSDEITTISVFGVPEFYQNSDPQTQILRFTNENSSQSIFIPPYSTLVNRLIKDSGSFDLPNDVKFPRFNLVILDPPWPNRSVKRKSNYSTSTSIQTLLTNIPIPSLLAPGGVVGLWITNRPAFHTLILDPGGLFNQWGIDLLEEWVWVKITKDGDPMCDLDGLWRKPYEILLVGRKMQGDETKVQGEDVTRRVIFAVPDIHSRKPNLKGLFEESGLLQDTSEYDALEIFARNLTSGWWGLGNEVVKFQEEQAWI